MARNSLDIEIECKCGAMMKKGSGTAILTYYCPACKNLIEIREIRITIGSLL